MFPEHLLFNKLFHGLLELRTHLTPGVRYMFSENATEEEWSFF